MKTMRMVLAAVLVTVCAVFVAQAWDQVNTSVDGLNVKGGTLKIDGTAVTATAAQLNNAATVSGGGTVAASTLTGNIAQGRITNAANSVGAFIGGNIPLAAISNAANTVGPFVMGNVPVASITNAAGSLGPSVGGNIPIAAISNALSAVRFSGSYTNASTLGSNVVTVLNGVIVSVTVTPAP